MRSGERRGFGIGGWGLGNCGVRTTDYRLSTSVSQTLDYRLQTSDCKRGNGRKGLVSSF